MFDLILLQNPRDMLPGKLYTAISSNFAIERGGCRFCNASSWNIFIYDRYTKKAVLV